MKRGPPLFFVRTALARASKIIFYRDYRRMGKMVKQLTRPTRTASGIMQTEGPGFRSFRPRPPPPPCAKPSVSRCSSRRALPRPFISLRSVLTSPVQTCAAIVFLLLSARTKSLVRSLEQINPRTPPSPPPARPTATPFNSQRRLSVIFRENFSNPSLTHSPRRGDLLRSFSTFVTLCARRDSRCSS